MKTISLLGSTGSIGTQTLDIVRANSDIRVSAIAARSNIDLLEKQIREFSPQICAVWDEEKAKLLRIAVADTKCRVLSGQEGIIAVATHPEASLFVNGIVGMRGIEPTIEAIRAFKDIALANKETLVCAGHIIMPLARKHAVRILPVDSEHSAIFQCLRGQAGNPIEKILLTCSGGPFRTYSREMLEKITVKDALAHPTWSMGRKITIDSSTLANKGLEVIEAHWLFNVDVDRIQVLVQPGSVIHSMVQFMDGAVIAQLGTPDMHLPIQYALCYPERRYIPGERLDLLTLGQIPLEAPRTDVFPALALAYEAGRKGGSMPAVFNAANEYAVDNFIEGRIGYTDIPKTIEKAMANHTVIPDPSIEDIVQIGREMKHMLLKV